MANHTINDNQLTEGALIFVKGILNYSRLASKIEGKELEADKQRKQQHGINPVDRPYTTATISEAEVVPQDANNPTIEDKFVQEHMFRSKNGQGGMKYSINNTGSILPRIAVINEKGTFDEITPKGELANGLKVMLVLRVYKSKNFNRKSLSLQRVLVMEPIRYYSSNQIDEQMVARGITINSLSDSEREKGQEENAHAAAAAFEAQLKAPQPSQVSAPTGDPFANTNTQPAAPVAPVAAPAAAFTAPVVEAPADSANWTCPGCGATVPGNMKFCGSCGTAKPAGNPYAPETTVNDRSSQGGICFDPNDNDRNY